MFSFTEKDKEEIKKAVQDLEQESSGEIVPYFTQQSDDYSEITWYVPAVIGILSAFLFTLLSYMWLLPTNFDIVSILISQIVIVVATFLVFKFVPNIRISFVNSKTRLERVKDKAKRVFLEEEVFNTVDRTGILIYISYLEKEVLILGDSGINAKVRQEEWDSVVQHIILGIKEKNITKGIVVAINECKDLLLKNGFTVRKDDKNELSDDLRID